MTQTSAYPETIGLFLYLGRCRVSGGRYLLDEVSDASSDMRKIQLRLDRRRIGESRQVVVEEARLLGGNAHFHVSLFAENTGCMKEVDDFLVGEIGGEARARLSSIR